jgi:type VI secretion system protein VasJ
MSTLNTLLSACQTEQAPLLAATRERVAQWDSWLQPLSEQSFAGEDPGYDDDFARKLISSLVLTPSLFACMQKRF